MNPAWRARYKRDFEESDVQAIFEVFEPLNIADDAPLLRQAGRKRTSPAFCALPKSISSHSGWKGMAVRHQREAQHGAPHAPDQVVLRARGCAVQVYRQAAA